MHALTVSLRNGAEGKLVKKGPVGRFRWDTELQLLKWSDPQLLTVNLPPLGIQVPD